MPNSKESSSDDLIAELARLMAEEAQGERDGGEAKAEPAPEPEAVPEKPAEAHRLPDGGNVVRIPGGRPAASTPPSEEPAASSEPAGSVWGRALETPSAANSDFVGSEEPVAPTPVETRTPAPKPEPAKVYSGTNADISDDEFLASLGISTGPKKDAAKPAEREPRITDASDEGDEDFPAAPMMTGERAASGRDDALDIGVLGPDDPIAQLIAEQAREEENSARVPPEPAPEPEPEPVPAPTPPKAAEPAPAPERREPPPMRTEAPARSGALFSNRQPQEPAPQQAQDPAPPRAEQPQPADASAENSDLDENVLSLLRAMDATRSDSSEAASNRREADDDHFSASPIFGPGSGTPSKAKTSDPLDEIESLIGDAVKVGHERPSMVRQPEPEPDFDDAAYAAEAAIAAATAETAARPERVRHRPDLSASDFSPQREEAIGAPKAGAGDGGRPNFGNNRLMIGAAAAATLLVVIALGLFWLFGMNGEPDGTVPVIASNTDAAKERVEQNTESATTSQPAIFQDTDPASADAGADEQIVSRDQSDAVANDVRQVAMAETGEEGLANRKVRTVTVRPDGTIVSNDETLAGNEVLPVTRPEVPTLSGETGSETDFQVATAPQTPAVEPETTDQPLTDPIGDLVEGTSAETAGVLVPDAPFPTPRPADPAFAAGQRAPASNPPAVTNAGTSASSGTNAVAPASSNDDTIDLIAGRANQIASNLPTATSTTQTTSAPAATTPTSAPAVTATSGPDAPAYVQLSSQRSEEAARSTLSGINQRFATLFNGANAFIRRVDLGDRGIFYRVLVPSNSAADANGVCASVKAAGGDCFVRNN